MKVTDIILHESTREMVVDLYLKTFPEMKEEYQLFQDTFDKIKQNFYEKSTDYSEPHYLMLFDKDWEHVKKLLLFLKVRYPNLQHFAFDTKEDLIRDLSSSKDGLLISMVRSHDDPNDSSVAITWRKFRQDSMIDQIQDERERKRKRKEQKS